MTTHSQLRPIVEPTTDDELAEVLDLPINVPSFYQKNSGSLPKTNAGISDAHRRGQLPNATNDDEFFLIRLWHKLGF